MFEEEDYLQLSGIQHFAFCRRQWALIHIESQWEENVLTVSGDLMHARVHTQSHSEKRGNVIIARSMPIYSKSLGVRGNCDVVEFYHDDNGISIFGREGLWLPCPIEYKRGKPKTHDADKLQLCAQAMCLEEMLSCPEIRTAFLYYGEPKRRETLQLDSSLRETVRVMFTEMHSYYDRRYTPRVKKTKACTSCSLKNSCLPKLPPEGKVATYIKLAIEEESRSCENS